MRFYVLHRWQCKRSGLLLGLFLLLFILTIQVRTIERRLHGVRSGIRLEELPVAGLLPSELSALVQRIAADRDRPPQNAMFFEETGQIIPARPGLRVDVDATVAAVCRAAAGSKVQLVMRPVPAAVTGEFFNPVFQGPANLPEVALSFNVAWGEEYLPRILEILQREKIKASFFFVGDWVEKFPELVRAVAAGGHEIGNHGLHHSHPRAMGQGELNKLILENDALLRRVTGLAPARLFAPPSGEFDRRTVGIAAALGFRTILWTVDTVDWKKPAPELIRARVAEKAGPGSIILMHPTAPTVAALPGIISDLRAKGLTPVTVGRLLR